MAHFRDSDGKSEATLLLEALLGGMDEMYDAYLEVLRIPLGVMELDKEGFQKWWNNADEGLRKMFIQQNGLERTLGLLSRQLTKSAGR